MSAVYFRNSSEIEEKLQKTSSDILNAIHFVLYGRYVKPNFLKRNIRKFSGFPFESEERETFIKSVSESLSLKQLKAVAEFFDLNCDAILDALEISGKIIDRVETLAPAMKSTSVQSLKSVKSKKSSNQSVRSRCSELKMSPKVQLEICQLKESALLKEAEIIEIESEILAMKGSSGDSAVKDKDISLKERLLEKKRQLLKIDQARIDNKEKMLEECKTIEDGSACEDNSDIASVCEESAVSKNESIAAWSCNAARMNETDEQMRDLKVSFNSFLSRQTVGNNVTFFDGSSCLKWPVFLSQFENASVLCKFSDQENVMRLDQSLRGEARQCVELLLCTARDPHTIISILKTKYRQPDMILSEILKKINGLPRVVNSESLMELCCMIRNIAAIVDDAIYNFVDQRSIIVKFVSKLPAHLLTQWGTYLVSNGIRPREENLRNLAMWADNMADITSRTTFNADEVSNSYTSTKSMPSTSKQKCCVVCKTTEHNLDRCPVFKSSDTKRRWKLAENAHACYCCLSYHRGSCGNRKPCGVDGCIKFHHQLLHKQTSNTNSVHVTACTTDVNCHVLLKMIQVKLCGPRGTMMIKAILDEGSTTTLLDSSVAATLGLSGPTSPLCCKWTGDIYRYDENSQIVEAQISGTNTDSTKYFALKDIRTVKDLNLPNQKCDTKELAKKFPFTKQVEIRFDGDTRPMLLIGQNNAKLIVSRQVIQPNATAPILSKTALGWTLHGPITSSGTKTQKDEISFLCCENTDERLHQLVKEYFKLESFPVTRMKLDKRRSADDERALRIAENSIKYRSNRYEVALPWKTDNPIFPYTKPMAMQRLKCLENRLRRDNQLSIAYCDEIQKLLDKGYALPVQENELNNVKRVWYLPHFAVQNPNKPGKVRIVFDAAAKVNGISLNDYLLSGPDWLIPLFRMLCKFRTYKIAFTGDIEEMFNRVEITDDDSYAQCFLWRDLLKAEKTPKVYRMKAMLFGTASSPFLAQFVKNYNAEKYMLTHEEAATAIINDHYVDDFLYGAENEADALKVIKDVISIHSEAGFSLKKIISNSEFVNKNLSPEILSTEATSSLDRSPQKHQRILGMLWNSVNDTFGFSLNFHKIEADIISGDKIPTKRQVLKLVMSIFDPLGLLSPITIKSKILLQEIWRSGIGWDDFISSTMMAKWKQWLKELLCLKQLAILRFIPLNSSEIELHVFNDASESAYATAMYARITHCNVIKVVLIAAKARVAPLKTITIPKMELSAALMGAKLCEEVVTSLNLIAYKKVFWTDSRTVLHWIKSDKKLQTFVAARTGEILELSDADEWHWLPSNQNIADICTRDGSVQNFDQEHDWFKGPKFLYLNEYNFCESRSSHEPADINLNLRVIELSRVPLPPIKSHYTWIKLLRITARIKRFIDNLKCQRDSRKVGPITAEELLWSEKQWWKFVQESEFPVDIQNIKDSRNNRNGKLRRLALVIDNDNILRVSGRIQNAENIMIEKEPIVLSGKNPYVRLMLLHFHKKFGHQGLETVINEVRRKFWIPHLRSVTKKVFYDCLHCKKRKCKPAQPKMGLLPKERFRYFEKPFTATGIDYFGPFYVKSGRKIEKRYGVLFTCLTMRAIHVEIAHSLSTDSCIMAIRRFLSRRGSVKTFWTDNGTNFRGASRELMEAYENINEDRVQEELANRQIEWKFIPPLSPHMGGAWERLIGCFKRTLLAIMTDKHPTDEVLATTFAEIEYIVNSRPLTHVSGDNTDNCSITPNDLLIGRSAYVRSPGLFDEKDLLLRRQWRISQALVDSFWKRWLREYLPTLIGRSKWTSDESNLQEGELVIVNDPNLPRGEWPMGIILRVYEGADGIVRVADVKCTSGVYQRPATKLHRLSICVDPEVNTEGEDVADTAPAQQQM